MIVQLLVNWLVIAFRNYIYFYQWRILIWRSGLAEGYAVLYRTLPLYQTCGSGFAPDFYVLRNKRHFSDMAFFFFQVSNFRPSVVVLVAALLGLAPVQL